MSSDSSPWAIPGSWVWATMGEVAEVVGGGTPRTDDPANFENGDIPWVTPADLSGYKDKYISRGARNITRKGLDNSGAQLLPAGSVLFSSRAPIGYVAIAANPVCTNQGFKSFVLPEGLLPDYCYYFLQRGRELAVGLASGTTFLEVSGKKAAQIPASIAPQREQRRIVAEIEKQLTRVEAAVAALRRVQVNLKRYRAAVLKAAVEGRVVPTEAELARAEGRSYEPADQLLQRILAERRACWEADQLAKLRVSGKEPKDDWRTKYKQPAQPDTRTLPALPKGWTIGSLEQLTSPVRVICYGILMPKDNIENGIPYVRVLDLKGDRIDVPGLRKTSPAIAAAYARASLTAGDLLLAIRGSYGRVAEVPPELEGGNITQDTARLDIAETLNHRYIAICLRSPIVQNYFKGVARGVAVRGVNIADVRSCPVPLPPVGEQQRIVAEVERRLSVVDELQIQVEINLKRAERLRQAILKRAFEGKLVPQEPDDEPASVLLERIRAEREARKQQATGGTKKGRQAKPAKAVGAAEG